MHGRSCVLRVCLQAHCRVSLPPETVPTLTWHVHAQAQFDAEQEQLQALSYLSADEQAKYAERQSISFMYMKPPGYDTGQQKVRRGRS